jgi:hypothetical protein
MPKPLSGCQPTVIDFRQCLNVKWVLPQLRELAAAHLAALPSPIGFASRPLHNHDHSRQIQHDKGPDPPPRMS